MSIVPVLPDVDRAVDDARALGRILGIAQRPLAVGPRAVDRQRLAAERYARWRAVLPSVYAGVTDEHVWDIWRKRCRKPNGDAEDAERLFRYALEDRFC